MATERPVIETAKRFTGWYILAALVGVNLLMTGISRLMFGLAARKLVARATA